MQVALDQATLRSLVHYDPETGVFTWLRREEADRHSKAWNTRYASKNAGSIMSHGYVEITLGTGEKRERYTAHRLAWLYIHGEFPEGQIDHANRDRADNRICNLRLATQTQNNHNMSLRSDNTSGAKGVCWVAKLKKWLVRIWVSGRCVCIGYFDSFEDAKLAYADASLAYAKEFSIFSDKAA